jgi:putative (di)nucleoside polyphosphate hydrolase
LVSEYRASVLAVFTNAEGLVLVAERADGSEAWQFPQGGIEAGEAPEEALAREMGEELGCAEFEVLARAPELVRYFFPKDMRGPLAKLFRGQDQVWFLARFRSGAGPDLERASDKEFRAWEWVTPREALRRAVVFKKDAYERGLRQLGFALAEPDHEGG